MGCAPWFTVSNNNSEDNFHFLSNNINKARRQLNLFYIVYKGDHEFYFLSFYIFTLLETKLFKSEIAATTTKNQTIQLRKAFDEER